MKNLLSILFLVAVVVTASPSHAQKMTMNEMQHHCKRIFVPSHCERFEALGAKAVVAFAEALATLIHDGLEEANKELDLLLRELEEGRTITNKKALKKGLEI